MATDSTRRLHHATPAWVRSDATFHIRIRSIAPNLCPLSAPPRPAALLESAKFYHDNGSWFCRLFLLMPDHIHALLCFPPASDMRVVVGRWKAWQTRRHRIAWQDTFFDHRIRDAHELRLKTAYIRQNPVVKGLCEKAEDWSWVIDHNPIP